MKIPILVVHGIANHDQTAFNHTVADLATKVNAEQMNWQMVPVFWGDLGGHIDEEAIADMLPNLEAEVSPPDSQSLARYITPAATQQDAFAIDGASDNKVDLIVASAFDNSAVLVATQGMDAVDADTPLRDAVQEKLPETRYLQFLNDPGLLKDVGEAIGKATDSIPKGPMDGADFDFGFLNDWSQSLKDAAKGVIEGFDSAISSVGGRILGNVNHELRQHVGPAVIRSLGDIMAYERNSALIQARLWKALADAGFEGWGTKDKPVSVIAHSLGGVIVIDAAMRQDQPLYISTLLTFGSQSSFFNVAVPRGILPLYTRGHSIPLAPTLQRWVNLYEPLDFLAFLASPVFSMASASALTDKVVPHHLSYGLYTHSIYWQTNELAQVIAEIFH
ncbi:hypothetical protein IAD21_03300 [Abditibacteriota bacterium]|nr:hypothetical protein IAD21_03300 [Abditibacteriota bacterium]